MATKKDSAGAPAIDGLEVVSEVQRMEIRPGDVVVVKCEVLIRPEFKVYLQKQIRAAFPDNKVIVIDGGIELQVLADPDGAEVG